MLAMSRSVLVVVTVLHGYYFYRNYIPIFSKGVPNDEFFGSTVVNFHLLYYYSCVSSVAVVWVLTLIVDALSVGLSRIVCLI